MTKSFGTSNRFVEKIIREDTCQKGGCLSYI